MSGSAEQMAINRAKRKQPITLLQERFIKELPKNGYKIAPSAVKAGYSYTTAYKNPDSITKSPGIKAAFEELGITNDYISKEYRKITDQDKDLTNKRLSLERSAEFINPELAQKTPTNGNINTINVYGADAIAKMSELQAELKRLESGNPVKHPESEDGQQNTA